jgi:hypothetical protein
MRTAGLALIAILLAAAAWPQAHTARSSIYIGGNTAQALPGGAAISQARCPSGTHAISGGWNSNDQTTDPISITSSVPRRGFSGWVVVARDQSSDPNGSGYVFQATVICQ